MDWLAAIFGITGSILLSRGDKRFIPHTFVCYIIGSASWMVFGVVSGLYSLVLSSSIFITIEFIGLFKWIKVNKINNMEESSVKRLN